MDIWMLLEKAATELGRSTAVVDGDLRLTYEELHARACRLAGFFRARQVQHGDRISILDLNSHEYIESYFAAAALGAILNPINHRLSGGEVAQVLEDAGTSWLLVRRELAPLLSDVPLPATVKGIVWMGGPPPPSSAASPHEYEAALASAPPLGEATAVASDDVAHLYYTSGSTGRPKGVMLTHRNVCVHALGNIAELHLTDGEVWGHFAPLFHLADAWATFAITWVGGCHVILGRFDAEGALAMIEREKVTMTALIPTMVNMMVHHEKVSSYRYDSLRRLLTSGAPIAEELVAKAMDTFGCDYVQAYGLTETSPHLLMSTLKASLKLLSPAQQMAYRCKTGRPFIAVTVRVVDDDGRAGAPDGRAVGEIQVRGDTIMAGYWKNAAATAATFDGGWLCTGDLAVVDEEGYVNIVDRKKDMIVTGGENVFSAEVENVLYEHPKVLEAAVFGVPDPKWGEAVKAAVVLQKGQTASAEEIIAFCKAHLGAYKVPKSIDFVTALPHSGSGKISKKALRAPYWTHSDKQV